MEEVITKKLFKKLLKIFLWLIGIVSVIAMVSTIIFVIWVDQNSLKNEVTKFMGNYASNQIEIDGELSIKLFPVLCISASEVSIGNYPDLDASYFAKASKVLFEIKILPLLRGRIVVDKLSIEDLHLRLASDCQMKSKLVIPLKLRDDRKQINKSSSEKIAMFMIKDIRIINGKVVIYEPNNSNQWMINNLNLRGKGLRWEEPFSIKSSFSLSGSHTLASGELKLDFNLLIKELEGESQVENLHLLGRLKKSTMESHAIFKGEVKKIRLNSNESIIKLDKISIDLAGLTISGDLGVNWREEKPRIDGEIKFNTNDLSEIMRFLSLGHYFKVPTKSGFRSVVHAADGYVKTKELEAYLGDAILHGEFKYGISDKRLDLSLNLNQLKLVDLFLDENIKNTDSSNTKMEMEVNSFSRIPKEFKLYGDLTIGQIEYQKLMLNNVTTKLLFRDQYLLEIKSGAFDLYGGKVNYEAVIDLMDRANFSLEGTANKIKLRSLFSTLAGYEKFDGVLDLDFHIEVQKIRDPNWLSRFYGKANIAIVDGVYYGIDIPYEVKRVHAILNSKKIPPKTDVPATKFDRLGMEIVIKQGIVSGDNFSIDAEDYTMTGAGVVNLVSQKLDFSFGAYSKGDKTFFVPVRIIGPFKKPTIELDTASVLEHTFGEMVQDVVKKKLNKYKFPSKLKSVLPFNGIFN